MAICVQRHSNVSKKATLLDGLDASLLKWRVCGCGLNRFVHESMNDISNVKVHLKTRNGNINIVKISTIVDKCCVDPQNFYFRSVPTICLVRLTRRDSEKGRISMTTW